MSYYRDRRVLSGMARETRPQFDERKMTLRLVLRYEDDEDEGVDEDTGTQVIELPAEFEVCGTCSGKGTHVDPSIDAEGITGSEWNEWSHEEREGYRSGAYDVQCYECGGQRVVPVVKESALKPEQKRFYEIWQKEMSDRETYIRDQAREREMGY